MLLLFYVYIIFARINKVRVKQTLNISYTQLTILASLSYAQLHVSSWALFQKMSLGWQKIEIRDFNLLRPSVKVINT